MRFLAEWSVRNKAAVHILVAAWLAGGLYAAAQIRREFFPEISLDIVQVITILPGATPEDVERLLTDPLEDEIVNLSGVDRVESVSTEGRSVITVFVDPDAGDVEQVRRDVERAVDLAADLPDDAEDPIVMEVKSQAPVLSAAILGEAPWETRKRLADRLKDRFRGIPGVTTVIVDGLREREILVEVDPERLAARRLGAADVAEAIRAARADLPAGTLRTRGGDVLVRSVDSLESAEAVGMIVVRPTPAGVVRIRDVATVREGLAEEVSRGRSGGRPAVFLTVMKSQDGDVLEIARRLKAVVAEESAALSDGRSNGRSNGLSIGLSQDLSEWVEERLGMAYWNGLQGFVLVLLLLAVFLDLPSAAWCAYGIFSATIGGLLVLYLTGGTLNMLSIFGFILVLGMLDDDAITVVENVAAWRDRGLSAREAVVRGVSEVARPVTAAILTTSAALLPLALMTGHMGKFMRIIPQPGLYCLAASLFDLMVLMPAHILMTSTWGRPRLLARPLGAWDRVRAGGDRFMAFLRRRHRALLVPILRRRYWFLGGVAAAFVAAVVVGATVLRFELVSTRDTPMFQIEVTAPAGTSLDETERIISSVEERVLRLPANEVEAVMSMIGSRLNYEHFGEMEFAREVAQVTVDLHEPDVRPRDADEIAAELRPMLAEIRGAEIRIEEMKGGPPVGRPLSVRLSGDDWGSLRHVAEEMKAFAATLPGAVDVDDDLREGKREVVLRARADAAALAGTTPGRIALEARAAADGIDAARVRVAGDEAKIRVRWPADRRVREADLASIRIPTPAGPAPLSNLAEISRGRGTAALRHYDGRRTITVSADLERHGLESREANARVRERFADDARAQGILFAEGGEAEDMEKSLRSIREAALLGVALIAIILVFQFGNFLQPLVILGTLPLAIIGVILTLVVHSVVYETTGVGIDAPMGMLAMIGMAALLGMVTNDAIVLVDFVNESRGRGRGRWASIVRASTRRLRPILLASSTTAVGVLPMAYTARGSSAFLAPMALTFGWGVLVASVLTLFVIPVLLAVVDDLRARKSRRLAAPTA